MSEQYNILYSSMDQLLIDITTRTDSWYTQLSAWQGAYTSVINMSSFTGQSATAIKSYLSEVHAVLVQSIYVAIARFQSEFLLYKDRYYDIEDNIYATMSQETIQSIETRLSDEITYLNNIAEDISGSLKTVSDIFGGRRSYKTTLEEYLISGKSAVTTLNSDIEFYETSKQAAANGEVKDLLEALRSTILMYSNSVNAVVSYESGDICGQPEMLDLCRQVVTGSEYIQNHQEAVDLAATHQQEVFAQMQADYEAACKAREDEGVVKMITGAAAIIVGGAAIILTAGAATPIVVTATVTGTCSMAYGISNMEEGAQDVYYGSIGDLNTAAINPIRDTIFMGNQGAYDTWGNINMMVAGLCIPVSQSVNGMAGANNAVLAKVAQTVAKEVVIDQGVDWVSSNITNFAAEHLDLSQTEATLLNMGLSFGLDKGVDAVGTRMSGNAPFAESMDYDEAARYNEYWARVESGSNTGYPGLTDADIRAWEFADSRVNEHIAVSQVDTDAVVNLRAQEAGAQNAFLSGGGESGKNSILAYEDAENRAFDAICGSTKADTVVLGKFDALKDADGQFVLDENGRKIPTENSYNIIAQETDAQYFQLDNWEELAVKYSDDEIWKINEKFLDIQTSSGREIYLSHNPNQYKGDGSFYAREIKYLEENGYHFYDEGGIWHAVR